jgi:hypothetical protein
MWVKNQGINRGAKSHIKVTKKRRFLVNKIALPVILPHRPIRPWGLTRAFAFDHPPSTFSDFHASH